MKRRVHTQPTNPFYSNEPAVATSLMADKPLTPNAALANKAPKSVDAKPDRLSGIAGFSDKHKPNKGPSGPKPVAVNATAKSPAKLRMSGHSGAHRVGAPKSKI